MVSQVFNLLLTSWNAVYGWFVSLTDAMGAWLYISAVFFVMIAVRFILAPALQAGVSDGVTMVRSDIAKTKPTIHRQVIHTHYLGGKKGG